MPADPPPLSYDGPNADLVNEVVAFAFSEQVFSSNGRDERLGSLVIVSDMVRAVDAAGGVGPESGIRIDRAALRHGTASRGPSDDEWLVDWTNLKQILVADCIWTAQWYEWEKANAAAAHTLKSMDLQWDRSDPRPLYEHLLTRLPEGPRGPEGSVGYYRDYIADNASSDLRHCAENRAFNGITDNFWESLFRIYRMGLWPCGWRGTWPSFGVAMAWRRPQPHLTHRQPWPLRLTRPHIVGRWLRGWRTSDDRWTSTDKSPPRAVSTYPAVRARVFRRTWPTACAADSERDASPQTRPSQIGALIGAHQPVIYAPNAPLSAPERPSFT